MQSAKIILTVICFEVISFLDFSWKVHFKQGELYGFLEIEKIAARCGHKEFEKEILMQPFLQTFVSVMSLVRKLLEGILFSVFFVVSNSGKLISTVGFDYRIIWWKNQIGFFTCVLIKIESLKIFYLTICFNAARWKNCFSVFLFFLIFQ